MSTKIEVEIDENRLKILVLDYLSDLIGGRVLNTKDVTIEVKSQQNYKSEWESASYRAKITKTME